MRTIEKNAKGQAVAPAAVPMTKKEFETDGQTRVYWLGGGGAMIHSRDTNVLIDPVLEGFDIDLLVDNPLPVEEVGKVDGVLITHIDNDHFSRMTLGDIEKNVCSMHAPGYVGDVMVEEGFKNANKRYIGETFVVGSLRVTTTPACHNWQNGSAKYNTRYWKEEDYCGYWIETKDGTIWMPGDSRLLGSHLHMSDPDVILFDFADNEWHITLEGAIELANAYPDADLICIHWGTVDAPDMTPFNGDPMDLMDRIVHPERIHVLAPGEAFVLKGEEKRYG